MPKKFVDSAAPPLADPPLLGSPAPLSVAWQKWFQLFPATFASIVNKLNTVTLSTQSAAITATAFEGGTLVAGNYRFSYCARITQAATTSSSLTVTFAWTEGGVAQSYSGSAITGNTTATRQSNTQMIRVDADTSVTYSTAYASVGATAMNYSLDILFERIRVDR